MKTLTLLTLAALMAVNLQAEENWARFRGPLGTGHTADTDVPVKWDASNVVWKVELEGEGQSSIVNWGDQLFLTSANGDGTERHVICLDRTTGEEIWKQAIKVDEMEASHAMNTFATGTCATDGEIVVAFFGPGGLHAFDMQGNKLWDRDLGDFPTTWGTAASPIIDGGLVIQNCDAEGPSRLVAMDRKSGETVWEADRGDMPKGGWSTPILIEYEGERELILNGEFGVSSYNPKTGKLNWFCEGFNGRGSPVPDFADGLLYVVNGKPGDCYAVKPGGSGDVTDTHRVWHARRQGGRDLPSPAVVGDYLLISSMSGILTSYDPKTGEDHFSARLDAPISAAPLVANGLVYFQAENGEVIVVRPGKELDIVARNTVDSGGQIFRATLAPIQGQIFARSLNTVYCIGEAGSDS